MLNDHYVTYISSLNPVFIYAIKLVLSLAFLIFIRAGLPRYRYDFLTKLGWVKFLLILLFTLILAYFSFSFWY